MWVICEIILLAKSLKLLFLNKFPDIRRFLCGLAYFIDRKFVLLGYSRVSEMQRANSI